ncbi:MAG: UMP kinase [Bacteroidetes bacterium]|nr:UMP kinase [Bacteroidota bacterium]
MELKYKRILLKLSGEALMGNKHYGISATAINDYVSEIKTLHKLCVQVAIVIGGGNFYRGVNAKDIGINNTTGDKMGMLSTIMNGLSLKDVLEKNGTESKIYSAIFLPQIADVFQQEKAIQDLQKNTICIFVGGTGNPLFTTDSAAALRSIEIGADILIKATDVDGIYSADPKKDTTSKMFNKISYQECIERNLKVMDRTAFVLCKENNMPIVVMNINKKGNLLKVVSGEDVGTIVM